jgi:ABC-2 type transport system permease protein
VSRTRTALAATVKQFARTPVLLALLVVLPAYFVGVLGAVLPESTVRVETATVTTRATMVEGVLPMLAVLAAVVVAAVGGLFLTVNTLAADGWLSLSGLPVRSLFAARAGVLLAVAAVGSVAATAVLLVHASPERVGVFLAATVLLAATYGLVGAVAGAFLNRLGGVYAMLFAPTVDLFLFHSPLATDAPGWAALLPGRWAGTAAMEAAIGGDPNWSALGVGVAWFAVAAVFAGVAVRHAVRE